MRGGKEKSLAEEEGAEKQHGFRRVCGHKHANEHRRGLAATAEGVPGGGDGDGWRRGGVEAGSGGSFGGEQETGGPRAFLTFKHAESAFGLLAA